MDIIKKYEESRLKNGKYWQIEEIIQKEKRGQFKEGIIFMQNIWTIKEIEKELINVGVKNTVWQGIEKELRKKINNYKVFFIGKTPKNKRFIKENFGIKYDTRVRGYYIYTPRSKKVHYNLLKLIRNEKEASKYKQLLTDIMIMFQELEVYSTGEYNYMLNLNKIKKQLRRRKIRATKERLEEEQKNIIKWIGKYNNRTEVRIGIPLKKNSREIDGKVFLFLEGIYFPFSEIQNYVEKLLKNMSMMMFYSAYSQKRKEQTKMMTNKMIFLFIRLIIDSQKSIKL
ncbi:hypothetical protein J4429_01115 [Candidatus Pacearchaeota archaeon]|nr:hypothetical protein [Candidatus Pacearchaeota archaeon]